MYLITFGGDLKGAKLKAVYHPIKMVPFNEERNHWLPSPAETVEM